MILYQVYLLREFRCKAVTNKGVSALADSLKKLGVLEYLKMNFTKYF